MSKEKWAEWYSDENYALIRYLRTLRFGTVTIEVHEKNPVKIKEAFKIRRLKNAKDTHRLSESSSE